MRGVSWGERGSEGDVEMVKWEVVEGAGDGDSEIYM